MNLAATAPAWLYLLLLTCLAAAAIEDALRMRISNVTCAIVALLAVAASAHAGPDWSLWQNLLVFAAILVAGTVAFAKGFVGRGDVKLLAAVGLWVPFETAPLLLLSIVLAGGVIAVLAMLAWQLRRTGTSSSKTRQIPYGLAVSIGAALVFNMSRN